jgi:hypothetical protein
VGPVVISTFNNRPISDMSRDEIISALDQAMGMLNAARRALAFEREMAVQRFSSDLVNSHTNAYRARPVMRQVQRQEVF